MHDSYATDFVAQLKCVSRMPGNQSYRFCLFTLAASSGKGNVTVWRTSVRQSLRPSRHFLNLIDRVAHTEHDFITRKQNAIV